MTTYNLGGAVVPETLPSTTTIQAHLIYRDGKLFLMYGRVGVLSSQQMDVVDASNTPVLQTALDNYIAARLQTLLGVSATKVP